MSTHDRFPSRVMSIRRPAPPWPIDPIDVTHPSLPEELDGRTILHLTDLHVRRGRPRTGDLRRIAEAVAACPADLVLWTGDHMNYPGDEDAAIEATNIIASACRFRLAMLGVLGNHDSAEFRRRMVAEIPLIRWLDGESTQVADLPLEIAGPGEPEDFLSWALENRRTPESGSNERSGDARRDPRTPFRIALAHYPTEIYPAAEFGIPLVLAGHTHGGQIRLSPSVAPHTSTDLPGSLACGMLRYRDTLCVVSRGLGQAVVELRVNCAIQAPLYTLRRGAFEDSGGGSARDRLTRVRAW